MAPPYRVLNVDLSVVQTRAVLDNSVGKKLAGVSCQIIPAGQIASISFGINGDLIRLFQGYGAEVCPPDAAGIFLTVPAGQAGIMQLAIYYDDGASVVKPNP